MTLGTPPLTLYVHMPWCVRKCPYCDFNSHQLKTATPDRSYIASLIADFESEAGAIGARRIETVFFGGGTPSLFSPDDFALFLEAIRARASLATDAEITLEANPGTIERGKFQGYRDAGINRVSLGAQTFSAAHLQSLGRIHGAADTVRSVEELRAAGLDNFNVDLMYALPEQTPREALADLVTACDLGPAHLSHYQLTLEPGTVFYTRPPPLPDEESAWQMQQECQSLLAARGYQQYEVSAYAQTGAACRHNVNYWRYGDYLGIGAGAHGKLTDILRGTVLRTAKPKQPGEYQRAMSRSGRAPIGERREVPDDERAFEFLLNALRLVDGFSCRDFELHTGLRLALLEPRLRQLHKEGWLESTASGWRASALGFRFLTDLQSKFLPEVP
jgi:putative oxygen-independent coproporphyrinogen III oxidase